MCCLFTNYVDLRKDPALIYVWYYKVPYRTKFPSYCVISPPKGIMLSFYMWVIWGLLLSLYKRWGPRDRALLKISMLWGGPLFPIMSCLKCLTYYFTFLSIYSFVNVVAYSPTIHVALFLFSSLFLCEHCYLIYQLCGLRYFAFLLCYVVDVATYSPTMWVTLLFFPFLFLCEHHSLSPTTMGYLTYFVIFFTISIPMWTKIPYSPTMCVCFLLFLKTFFYSFVNVVT